MEITRKFSSAHVSPRSIGSKVAQTEVGRKNQRARARQRHPDPRKRARRGNALGKELLIYAPLFACLGWLPVGEHPVRMELL